MTDHNRWILLVSKLLEATQQNKIRWNVVELPGTRHREKMIKYETYFMNQKFRVRKEVIASEPMMGPEITLTFIDEAGREIYVVPPVEGLEDLVEAVQFQVAGIDQFLKNLVD